MSEALQALSDGLADVVEKSGPSIVRVDGRRRLSASGIVWREDGVIVTANHVLHRDENITVGLPDGETLEATLVGRDATTDLTVLRVEASGLAVAEWSAPQDNGVGHIVLALGRPGQTVQATMGIVSALRESWRTRSGGHLDYYMQTDVVMYPGFSGGPLANVSGQLVGMNTSRLVRGVSLTVPGPTIERVSDTLLEHGHIRRGYLGVGAQPAALPEALAEELGQETGLLVVSVDEESPAQKGGLMMGDTLVAFAGEPVRQMDDLLVQLTGERVGSETAARVVRGGKLEELTLVVGERPQSEREERRGRRSWGRGWGGHRGHWRGR